MSNTKKIAINPEFFKLNNISGKGKKKDKKSKHSADLVKPNLKKELINKVNEHRKNIQKEKVKTETKTEVKEISNNIDQSLEYLNNLAKKSVEKKRKKREKTRHKTMKSTDIKEAPPYSNLKTSNRPTYKQWRKTIKNNEEEPAQRGNISFGEGDNVLTDVRIFEDTFEERQKKLDDLKNNFVISTPEDPKKKQKVKRKHKTIRRKMTLGKHKNCVGVLIKNKKTRKNIKKEMDTLRKKSMNQIKKYLRKHNLIKIGCAAPESMLRDMFTDIYSSGDVYNKNPEILLHNYVEAK
ncbi:MAG: hypothetical protein H8E55_61845 [Pelagibacterales bacterium]|nr:hypothetical protein [Pelagibacterales bacterium]